MTSHDVDIFDSTTKIAQCEAGFTEKNLTLSMRRVEANRRSSLRFYTFYTDECQVCQVSYRITNFILELC